MIELRRADIGFGRIEIDELGVRRLGLLRDQTIEWSQIRSYFLTIELVEDPQRGLDLLVELEILRDIVGALEGKRHYRLGIELCGENARVAFNWRFDGATAAIRDVIGKLHPGLTAAARTVLRDTGSVQIGDITLSESEIAWGKRGALPRAQVETIELFDSSPVRLRVMQRGKAWPFAQAATHEVPNVATIGALAHELGYKVRGGELLEALVTPADAGRLV